MKFIKACFISLILIGLFCGCKGNEKFDEVLKDKTEEIIQFKLDISSDASAAVVNRILKIKEQPISEIIFEKGTYHFYPDKAYELYRNISNHDDQVTVTPFPLLGLKNITINGQGSKFIFHGVMIPFIIHQSSNIKIENVTIDWGMPFHSEGLVVANNREENSYDLKISKDYPYEIRNGQLVYLKEYYSHSFGQSILFDPKTNEVAYNTEKYSNWFTVSQPSEKQRHVEGINYPYKIDKQDPLHRFLGKELKGYVKEVEPGVVRIFNHPKELPPVGLIMVSKGSKTLNRNSPAFHITETFGFLGQNVNINHCGGMGLIAENSSNLILNNFNVTPSKERMVSATADATHFVGCRGKVELKNCTFSNQLDDAANIHGAYKEVFDIVDSHTIGVRSGHFQQKGFLLGFKDDKIGFVRESESLKPYEILTLKSYKKINGRYAIVRFEEEIPERIKSGDLLENLSAYPDVVIRNCKITGNRARGLLIGSSKSTLIEKNYFHTEMTAILGPAHIDHWFEASVASNVIIRNNIFEDCAYGGPNTGVISFTAEESIKELVFKNIRIENNQFKQFDNLILQIDKAENLVFTNNTITGSGTFPKLFPNNPAFIVNQSKNINFYNNTYQGDAQVILQNDGSVPNLKFK